MMRRIVSTEHTKKPQYPPWNDELELKAHLTLDKICTERFCLHFDSATLIMGAVKRMKSYYESGIHRGNIKNFEAWFFLKCRAAARDERQHLLGRPKDKEKKKTFISIEKPGSDISDRGKPIDIPDLHKGQHHPLGEMLAYNYWKMWYASIESDDTFPPKTKAELKRRIEYVEQHSEKCLECAHRLSLTHMELFLFLLTPAPLPAHTLPESPS